MSGSQDTGSQGAGSQGAVSRDSASPSPWPVAELDRVRRMRVLAAGVHASYAEGRIDAPFDAVWAAMADLESSIPLMITDVRTFRVVERDATGTALVAAARGLLGQRGRFEVALDAGWCVMRNRFVVGGFAAEPDGDGTRFAACGGLRGAGARLAEQLVGTRGARRMIRRMKEHCEAAA